MEQGPGQSPGPAFFNGEGEKLLKTGTPRLISPF